MTVSFLESAALQSRPMVRMTSAGDEGEGARAATIRTAPRPQTLGSHGTRTRMVSTVWLVWSAVVIL